MNTGTEAARLKRLIDTAAGREAADVVIKNGVVANVFTGEAVAGDVALCGGYIAAAGGRYEGRETVDAAGRFVIPGLIESHIHIEASFLSPEEFARIAVPHGTTTVIADPHEIANVRGGAALRYMLDAASRAACDFKFMLPSCVPAAAFERNGARLDAAALEPFWSEPQTLGLGEFMSYGEVVGAERGALEKLGAALARGRIADGHCPALGGRALDAYAAASIRADHECVTAEEASERAARGMYVMLREGSACRNLAGLLPALNARNSRRFVLCSDDLHAADILEDGHLDRILRRCVRLGVEPLEALRLATLNAAECFRLADRGAIAPGLRADLAIVDNLRDFRADEVFVGGRLAARGGECLLPVTRADDSAVRDSVHLAPDFSAVSLRLPLASDEVYVIDMQPGGIVTGKGRARVKRDGAGCFVYDGRQDIVKIACIERHRGTGETGVALLRNYGIRGGAAALSVGHDSHNIIAAGTDDGDMALAVKRAAELGGGAVLARGGAVLEEMALPLGGVMSAQSGAWVSARLEALRRCAVQELGVNPAVEPLMTLCFMALPVIPALRITCGGLFDVEQAAFIPLEAGA